MRLCPNEGVAYGGPFLLSSIFPGKQCFFGVYVMRFFVVAMFLVTMSGCSGHLRCEYETQEELIERVLKESESGKTSSDE